MNQIEEKVKEFVDAEKMFTSVDIGNDIKKDGFWISNSDVSKYLKGFKDSNYKKAYIKVDNGNTATLHLPKDKDENDQEYTYVEATTPDEFEDMHD